MRPVASAYSVSAFLQPQFATLNTRCLIFYTYPLSVLQAKWFPLDPQPLPPKTTQTRTNPKLSPATIRRQICLSCPRLLPASNSPHDSSQHHRSKNSHFGMGGKKKKKTQTQMKYELPQRDLSLSLPRTSSPREETAMQPRLEALNSNSFQTIFCKTVNRYKETSFWKWRSSSSRSQWFSQRDAKALCI